MEKFVYCNYLLEIYKDLLTEKNYQIFNLYYGENLSISEIAELEKVSRSFVGSSIKNTEKKLEIFEKKLQILKKNQQLEKLLEINDLSKIKKELQRILSE